MFDMGGGNMETSACDAITLVTTPESVRRKSGVWPRVSLSIEQHIDRELDRIAWVTRSDAWACQCSQTASGQWVATGVVTRAPRNSDESNSDVVVCCVASEPMELRDQALAVVLWLSSEVCS